MRSALAKAALGEADAGIVDVSDAADAGDTVCRVASPDPVNVRADYPVAALAECTTGGRDVVSR